MAPNSIFCADVQLSNYSLTSKMADEPSLMQTE